MKAIKRAIILCWVMLIVCFIIKLIGGNWFEIICNNEHFIYICNYIDEHLILSYFIAFPVYIIPTFFLVLSCCMLPKPNWKQFLIIIIFLIIVWASQFIAMLVKMICEVIIFVTLPFIIRLISVGKSEWKTALKKTWYLGIIGCILNLTFQVISLITKNIGIKVVDDNTLISLILMIDYYIMIALYYLYVILKNKKEQQNG